MFILLLFGPLHIWIALEVYGYPPCLFSPAGIHVIARSGVRLNYLVYNLSSGKVERDCVFPTEAQAFMGCHRKDVALHNPGDVSWL